MSAPSADNGLQAERTELAWRRTQVSLCVVACLSFRGQYYGLVAVALVSVLVVGVGQRRRYRHSQAMLQGQGGQTRPMAVAFICAVLTLMAVWVAASL